MVLILYIIIIIPSTTKPVPVSTNTVGSEYLILYSYCVSIGYC